MHGFIDATIPLEAYPEVSGSPLLISVILLAASGTGALFVVGLFAWYRRRSVTYLLITTALGILALRAVVGLGTVMGLVPMFVHHLTAHLFDFLISLLLLSAVFVGRKERRRS